MLNEVFCLLLQRAISAGRSIIHQQESIFLLPYHIGDVIVVSGQPLWYSGQNIIEFCPKPRVPPPDVGNMMTLLLGDVGYVITARV